MFLVNFKNPSKKKKNSNKAFQNLPLERFSFTLFLITLVPRKIYTGKYGPEKTPYLDTFHAACSEPYLTFKIKHFRKIAKTVFTH